VIWRAVFVGLLLVGGGLGMFLWELERGMSQEFARTAAVNALLIGEVFYLFNVRSFTDSILNREGILGNPFVLLAIGLLVVCQALFTYLPALQVLFHTAGLDLDSWLRILAFGVAVLLVVEAEKMLFGRFRSGAGNRT